MKTRSFKKALLLASSYIYRDDLSWHLRVSVNGHLMTYYNTPSQVHFNLHRSHWKFIWLEYSF